jgi:hypothetical protein
MSNIIHLLPDAVANQIAAGEVIQRPASAVKELMENAVDAGATSIKVVLKDAGRALIQIIDNGSGMSPADAELCFERHATSKLASADDLFKIKTITVEEHHNQESNNAVVESLDVVASTNTLPMEKMVDCLVFTWFISTMHIGGVTSWYARFLKKHKNIPYEVFYSELENFLLKDTWFANEQQQIRQAYHLWLNTGRFEYSDTIINFNINPSDALKYATRMKLLLEGKMDDFIDNIGRKFLNQFIDDADLLNDLIKFQQSSVVTHKKIKQYPLHENFSHDIFGYITENAQLKIHGYSIFEYTDSKDYNINEFCSMLWYRRRQGFGRSKIKKFNYLESVYEKT